MRLTPLVFFIPTPTPTKCIQSTPHTIHLHEYINHSSLPSPHPISEPLPLTPLNGSNSSKNAYFQTQWPPVFLYQPLPQPNVSSQLPTPSSYTNILFIPLSLHPTQSLSPCPWPLWMAQIVARMHISRPRGHGVWKYAFLLLFEPFRGVKDKGSEMVLDEQGSGSSTSKHQSLKLDKFDGSIRVESFLAKFKSIEQTITFKLCFISQFKCNGLHDSFEILCNITT